MTIQSNTTDPQDELFDIVDTNDVVVGSATRREVHANKKLIHRSINVLVYNKTGALFFQKRSPTKDTDREKWTISCSGHVERGGDYKEAAHRELQEELGVDMEIEKVDKFVCFAPYETEMAMVFKASYEGPFLLNETEISSGTFFTQNELLKQLEEGKIKLSFMAEKILGKIGWLKGY
ncbi:NUDIX domain-containing protein [Candidatus Gottesmanbacteria bacterium]|nr:NUDIX domain-containing protein [Candidatus Gottesmanbacteria bacterium]